MGASGRKTIVIAITSLWIALSTVTLACGQVDSSTTSLSKKRFNIAYHLGTVELAKGFKGYITANWIDAWAGYIEDERQELRIGWAAGLIQYVSETRKKEMVWQKEETTRDASIKLSLFRNKSGDTLVARIGWLEFAALVNNKQDEETFMSVVRSFQKERCSTCLTFTSKIKN